MVSVATRWREQIDGRTLVGPRGLTIELSYVVSTSAVLVASAVAYPFRDTLGVANLSLFYVLLLFVVGLAFGTGPAITGAVFAFLVSDFFFYPPYFTLLLDKVQHLIGLLIFLGIGVSTGLLGARLRGQAEEATREARRTSMLYDLNRALIRR